MNDTSGTHGSGRKNAEPIIIKKYANRRLYNTGTSVYVTLEDLAQMVKAGDEFLVTDAKTGEDITRSVLAQIIFELEGQGQNLLPVPFLRQLIKFYGNSLQTLVPGFLDMSLQNFAQDQDRWRGHISKAFGAPFEAFEDQIRTNMSMFEKAFQVLSPFAGDGTLNKAAPKSDAEIEILRAQMAAMQSQLDSLSKKK